MTNKTKKLNREATLRNINGLSLGDRAYCGPYGTITCIKRASYIMKGVRPTRKLNSRRFKVEHSSKIANGGNYSMSALRKAICA